MDEAIARLGSGKALTLKEKAALYRRYAGLEKRSFDTLVSILAKKGPLETRRNLLEQFKAAHESGKKVITQKSLAGANGNPYTVRQGVAFKTAAESSVIALDSKLTVDSVERVRKLVDGEVRKLIVDRVALKKRSFKVFITLTSLYKRDVLEDGVNKTYFRDFHFSSAVVNNPLSVINGKQDIEPFLVYAYEKIRAKMVEMEENPQEGSDWIFVKFKELTIQFIDVANIRGGSYLPTPKHIAAKKCVVNVKTEGRDDCFKLAIVILDHPNNNNKNSIYSYSKHMKEFDMSGYTFPMSLGDIVRFEQEFKKRVNVFDCDCRKLYTSRQPGGWKTYNLLLIGEGDVGHYVPITNLNRFVGQSGEDYKVCDVCTRKFVGQKALENHKCVKDGVERVLPKKGDNVRFKNYRKMLEAPFVIYYDTESRLDKISEVKGAGELTQHHVPTHIRVLFKSRYPKLMKDEFRLFTGDECVSSFLKYAQGKGYDARDLLKEIVPMDLSAEEERSFQEAKVCYLCEKDLDEANKVRDHCHITGDYRGAAHKGCNINLNRKGYKIPVFAHNARGYDNKFILQKIGEISENPNCIAMNTEKMISFGTDVLSFVDTNAFLGDSLDKLVKAHRKSDLPFLNWKTKFRDPLLKQKGVFPYEWYDSEDKLLHTELPPKEEFYSSLGECGISDEEYERALKIFEKHCTTFEDYLVLYLDCDVLLMADVFESYRDSCLEYYRLDPAHYLTAPSLGWDALLLMTGVEIECFSEGQEDMLEMIKEAIKGGISLIVNRYAKANNPYMRDYDPLKATSYIMGWDATALYATQMCEKLPVGDYKWVSMTAEEILAVDVEGERGYIIECDVDIPEELHDYFNDYPLLAERKSYEASDFIVDKGDYKCSGVKKLVPNLENKRKYVCHIKNLQQAVRLGYKLVGVHRVLSFRQEAYMKKYIDFNIKKRADCASHEESKKNLFKLMNNAVFGKTMENVENHSDIKIFGCEKKAMKYAGRPSFKNFNVISPDLIMMDFEKTRVVYDKPIIVGFCILDLSKVQMADFWYGYVKRNYGDKARLLMTDTDSTYIHIECKDAYTDMKANSKWFDMSEYPKDSPFYCPANKKKLGTFGDDFADGHKIVEEFIGLRAKMYSVLHSGGVKQRCKGVKGHKLGGELTHERYRSCLNEFQTARVEFSTIRSLNQSLYTVRQSKIGLSYVDDKRYILDDGITTLAHGHHKAC